MVEVVEVLEALEVLVVYAPLGFGQQGPADEAQVRGEGAVGARGGGLF